MTAWPTVPAWDGMRGPVKSRATKRPPTRAPRRYAAGAPMRVSRAIATATDPTSSTQRFPTRAP